MAVYPSGRACLICQHPSFISPQKEKGKKGDLLSNKIFSKLNQMSVIGQFLKFFEQSLLIKGLTILKSIRSGEKNSWVGLSFSFTSQFMT